MDLQLLCAIHRIPFLSGPEKLLLWDLGLSRREFLSLGRPDLFRLGFGRRIRFGQDPWKYVPDQNFREAGADCRWLERRDMHLVMLGDQQYPHDLAEIYDPPFLLYVRSLNPLRGEWNRMPIIALVGTRRPSSAGIEAARAIARQLAAMGAGLVSGLARGIDGAGHAGALEVLGYTAAVLGHGVDRVYPQCHQRLARELLSAGGCLISEFPPATEPAPFRFPQRNRIISGMSRAVVLAEAPEKSGALITVDFALEQGRDVMVLRDLLPSRLNAGGRRIEECGAAAVSSGFEVLQLALQGESCLGNNCRN